MKTKKEITILAIETSCDDTGITIVKTGENGSFKVLSNIISSQVEIHKKWGGVYPALAKREHQKNLVPVLIDSLRKSRLSKIKNSKSKKKDYSFKFKDLEKILEREKELQKRITSFFKKYQKPDIDLIAVTNGPGLEPCLWTGVNFAKTLSYFWDLPIISVNHVKAHIFVNMLQNGKIKKLIKRDFPAICLIVSGGHTLLFLMKGFGKYEILGETRDDAAGECFDKTARILGLGYPGGPEISKRAAEFFGKPKIKLPRPMINTKDYDFSFSGLKTAVLYDNLKKVRKDKKYIQEMCKEIQQSIIDVLARKTINAAINRKAKSIILGGGVVANKELRKQFTERVKKLVPKAKLFIPKPENCTDNALMVAIAGYFKYKGGKKEKWKKIKVDANLKIE
ncbi:tRNA (adenosine(37)-N6)-threonylcarbamoyltransferase complex transferase subunit TsaD [Patescibacteria group bacterium]|nr:tRNA (adenosine(37)-N6)-threonylcarbamoyltransferase complex transferase subunit TsaD [Patescibacteria group bacterium]MBU4367313.1 tRNA (adenosine(37)-N6)-threonylcarbamoyltransferase complex transferase subunit TsaD [Patescibacteria group bacterium]MBU4461650.1 tRNA (adenosine(37)-N6)-threonylcarbamoyltransferase complex transferase subunit TsaD [Patescibacteria group bacterium]MCG2699700.1 tRNA (adenosine(37)-N6)-threonylcarbamoyltransferase complex transferase subunit TsaD [Candidatus Par